jgi:hydroxyacylglutathione hydrolase
MAALKRKYGIPFALHRLDEPVLKAVKTLCFQLRLFGSFRRAGDRPLYLVEGESVDVWQYLDIENHFRPRPRARACGVCKRYEHKVRDRRGRAVPDVAIGRTDLPGGDHGTLLSSIRDTVVHPAGRVPRFSPATWSPTTIGFEKENTTRSSDKHYRFQPVT